MDTKMKQWTPKILLHTHTRYYISYPQGALDAIDGVSPNSGGGEERVQGNWIHMVQLITPQKRGLGLIRDSRAGAVIKFLRLV